MYEFRFNVCVLDVRFIIDIMGRFKNNLVRLLLIYCIVIALIFTGLLLVPKYVLTIAAVVFLSVPYIFGKGLKLRISGKSFLFSLFISFLLIGTYILLFVFISKKHPDYSSLSVALVFNHLVAVSLPEEAFFRGFLQEELGNNLKSIVIVSILFALGHVVTICLFSGHLGLHCVTALLTFLPSLVMGYLYYKTNSVCGSVIFHFLANVAYISTSGYSVFY